MEEIPVLGYDKDLVVVPLIPRVHLALNPEGERVLCLETVDSWNCSEDHEARAFKLKLRVFYVLQDQVIIHCFVERASLVLNICA